ncbi:MAG: Vps62-related protein [Anaerolineales bacterium]|nr:Vps62-related protein [Anaerolineales bacterium]
MNALIDRPCMPADASDLSLLRRFEPVLRFTRGEKFYPMDIETYVRESSLWAHAPETARGDSAGAGRDTLLVPQGELNVQKLIEPRSAPFGTVYYLRFIEPLSFSEAALALAEQARLEAQSGNVFHPGLGRLARGGLFPRILDALFSLSFLLRGRVPAALAAAAELAYHRLQQETPRYTYYGRVTRQNGWTVLQYWFFYCYNNWRSGFDGVNDHEADWEHISIYLYEEDGHLIPEWVAYASHDFQGDDLRRRWDDVSELDFVEGHPVVYVGAGSHASYFRPGEYMAEAHLDLPDWARRVFAVFSQFWTETLGQKPFDPFRIPFVDYARGDGFSIGPGQPAAWSPVLIDESTPWVSQYRGLWGLFARDPISGENAPAGPMYNRDGSPRGAWYDPLGFAGLEKIPPPSQALALLEENCEKLSARQAELHGLIPKKAVELQLLGIKLKGMEGNPHLARQYAALEKVKDALRAEVRALRREFSENAALLESLTNRLERLRQGLQDDPQAHIHHLAAPAPAAQIRFERAAQTWAAISLSLLLFTLAGLMVFTPAHLGAGLFVATLLFIVTESVLRGAFVETVAGITTLLAVVSALILLFHFWYWILVALLLAAAVFLLAQRLRELT